MNMGNKKNVITLITVTAAVLFAYSLKFIPVHSQNTYYYITGLTRSAIHIGLLVVWGISVRRRVIQKHIRNILTAIVTLMIFWLTTKTLKYFVLPSPFYQRYLWYLFYAGMLFIPLLFLLCTFSFGKPEGHRFPKWTYVLYIFTGLLLLFVMTNDFHRQVFKLYDHPWLGYRYDYAWGYFVVIGWQYICGIGGLLILFLKSRIPNSKKNIRLPFIPIIAYCLYGILYLTHLDWLNTLMLGDMTVMLCLVYTVVIECCIQCRLIPSNTNYDEMFRIIECDAHITDADYNILLSTNAAATLSPDIMRAAENAPIIPDGKTRISSAPLKHGHVVWTTDISMLQSVLDELSELQENLEDENAILSEEYKVKTREVKIAEQNRLYDEITHQTLHQIELLADLTVQFDRESSEHERIRILGKTIVIGAYLKRRNNFIFISDKTPMLNLNELELALRESLANIKLCGIECGLRNKLIGEIPVCDMMAIYDLFEAVTEQALDDMSAIHVVIDKKNNKTAVTITTDTAADMYDLTSEFVSVICDDDGEWQITGAFGGKT